MESGEKKLVGLILLASRVAKSCLKPVGWVWFFHFIVSLAGILYLSSEQGWSSWLLVTSLLLQSVIGALLGFVWWSLSGAARVPEILLNSKKTWREMTRRQAERIAALDTAVGGKRRNLRRLRLTSGLLWDSRGVLDGVIEVQGLIALGSPLFWLLALVSGGGALLSSFFLIALCSLQYYFG